MTIGRVGCVGAVVKNAITNSSIESVNASSAPATMPGASCGQRHPHERAQRPGAEVARRLLEARVEVRHAREHDRRHERRREHRVREDHRVQAERDASSEKNVSRPMPSSRSGRMAGAIANARMSPPRV